jgi:hypothetical protein
MKCIASISYSYLQTGEAKIHCSLRLQTHIPFIISFTLSPKCHITSLVDAELLQKLFVQIR